MYYVYELRIVETGKTVYVGKGCGKRMYFHARAVKHSNPRQPVHRKLKLLMESGLHFVAVKVFESESESAVLSEEKRRIKTYGLASLFNSVAGGARTWAKSPEARQLFSLLQSGRTLSAATRKKISVALKGVRRSKETRARMSSAMQRSSLRQVSEIEWRHLSNAEIAINYGVTKTAVKVFRSRHGLAKAPYCLKNGTKWPCPKAAANPLAERGEV